MGQIHPCANIHPDDILRYAAAAEHRQTHPIAKAIITAANERHLHFPELDHARYEIGYGIQVNLPDRTVRVGSARFMELEGISIPPEINTRQEFCHEQGSSLIMVSFDEQLVGAIELHAAPRSKTDYQAITQAQHVNLHHIWRSRTADKKTRARTRY